MQIKAKSQSKESMEHVGWPGRAVANSFKFIQICTFSAGELVLHWTKTCSSSFVRKPTRQHEGTWKFKDKWKRLNKVSNTSYFSHLLFFFFPLIGQCKLPTFDCYLWMLLCLLTRLYSSELFRTWTEVKFIVSCRKFNFQSKWNKLGVGHEAPCLIRAREITIEHELSCFQGHENLT